MLRFENVTIRFPVSRGLGWQAKGPSRRPALCDVTWSAQPGECLGIVGRNGAGKSTMMRVAAGVFRPTAGRFVSTGRVAALLSLAGGFQPELTGRENVFLCGALLGLSRRAIDERLDSMLELAGIGDALDDPVRTYSSGMVARLGFAVSTSVTPDVLLIDEALSVGDRDFRRRAEARIDELIGQAKLIVICSHQLSTLKQRCGRVLWLDEGRIVRDGPAAETIDAYIAAVDDAPPVRLHAA